MKQLVTITKALADENRLRVMRALLQGELCVCQITELLSVSTATVSRHLSILQAADLVDSRKEGRWVYYRLPDQPAPHISRTITWLKSMYEDGAATTTNEHDAERLTAILCCTTEDLCRKHRPN